MLREFWEEIKMPTSEHGEFNETVKSPYSFEYYDSTWELELMGDLEKYLGKPRVKLPG